jgi:DNA-directed RNA polymerase subunit H
LEKKVLFGGAPMALKKITQHNLVPFHEVIPKDKVEEVLSKYSVQIDKLPAIASDDPVVKEMKAERGDLIKITRGSLVAGQSIYFRIVV